MVHPLGDLRRELTQRVVGQLSHVHDRVHAGQVVDRDTAQIPVQGLRAAIGAPAEPAGLVVTRIQTEDLVAGTHQLGRGQCAQVALRTGDEHLHPHVLLCRIWNATAAISHPLTADRTHPTRLPGQRARPGTGSGCPCGIPTSIGSSHRPRTREPASRARQPGTLTTCANYVQ